MVINTVKLNYIEFVLFKVYLIFFKCAVDGVKFI
jgi:hypothetical protein